METMAKCKKKEEKPDKIVKNRYEKFKINKNSEEIILIILTHF